MRIHRKTTVALCCLLALLCARTVSATVADGDKLMEEGKFKKAIGQYEEALKHQPDNGQLLVKLARAYDHDGWYGRSFETWEKYLEKFPEGEHLEEAKKRASMARRWVAVKKYGMGEAVPPVIEHLEKAIELDPKNFEARYWLGRVYFENGKFEKAIPVLEKALDIKPGDRNTQWLISQATGALEHGGEAYDLYVKAYPLYEKGKLEEALDLYKQSAAANPEFVNPVIWIARINMEMGNYDRAIEYWREVVSMDPENDRAKWFMIKSGQLKTEKEKEQKEKEESTGD